MLSHFEFVGIVRTLQGEISSSVEKEKRHNENARLDDQSETYRNDQHNDAKQQQAYQAGVRFALEQVWKLDHETK